VWESGKLRVRGSGSVKKVKGCLDWDMLKWVSEESLLKFLSNVMVIRIL